MKVTVSTIKAGQVVSEGCRYGGANSSDNNRFVGFKVGATYFSNLKDLKEFYGVSTLRDLEAAAYALKESVTAVFLNVSDPNPYIWSAHLWKGCFRVGTSADRLSLAPAQGA